MTNPSVQEVPQADLSKLQTTENELAALRALLEQQVDNIMRNTSLLSQVANYWGNVPLWQKIGVGIAVVLPSLFMGVLTCLSTIVVYTAASLILDDHHDQNALHINGIKTTLTSLGSLLSTLIGVARDVCLQFSAEVEKFKEENVQLQSNVASLEQKTIELAGLNDDLNQSVAILKQSLGGIKNTEAELKKALVGQIANNVNIAASTEILRKTAEGRQAEIGKLGEQIEMLSTSNTGLKTNLEHVRNVAKILSETMGKLLTLEKEQRATFDAQMKAWFDDPNAHFRVLTDALDNSSKKLANTAGQLESTANAFTHTNQEHQELLARQEALITRLEGLINYYRQLIHQEKQRQGENPYRFHALRAKSGPERVFHIQASFEI